MAFLKLKSNVTSSSSVEALVHKNALPKNTPFLVERTTLIKTKFDSGLKSLKLKITPLEPLEDFPEGAAIIAPQRIKQVFYDHIYDKKAKDEGVGNFKNFIIYHVGLERMRKYEDRPYSLIDFMTLDEVIEKGVQNGLSYFEGNPTEVLQNDGWKKFVIEIVTEKCHQTIRNENLINAMEDKSKMEEATNDFPLRKKVQNTVTTASAYF